MIGFGISNSPVTGDAPICGRCGAAVRIAEGACVGCLLATAIEPSDAADTDDFQRLLDEVRIRDVGWNLANYAVFEEIGRGGMGIIYRARQRRSRRIVALKRMLGYQADSHSHLQRFRREAEAAASLDHPNILPIYEVGEWDGLPFFSMRFAAGGSLQGAASAYRGNPRECVRLLSKITAAMGYAHQAGILHRDLKPGNVLLDSQGEPLVSDFGLAKWLDETSDLTRTLTIFGTPGFIAPEQAHTPADSLNATADIYSLGAILFDLLVGRPPFLGEHALAVLSQARERPAPTLRSLLPKIDRDLDTICGRCLERDPAHRYQTAVDLADDLNRWLDNRPITARPISLPFRGWRWVKRNRVLASSLAATFVIGSAATVRQFEASRLAATVQEKRLQMHSAVVLPLIDLDRTKPDSQSASALAESVRNSLTVFGPVRVTSVEPASVAVSGGGSAEEIKAVAHEARSRAVLAGTKRLVDGMTRISIRLLDGSTGDVLYHVSDRTDDVRKLAAVASKELYTILDMEDWSNIEAKQRDPALLNHDAADFISSGRDLQNRRTAVDLERALDCFRKAIAAEPRSALAHSLLAMAAFGRSQIDSSAQMLEIAEQSARTALTLNPQMGEAHRALAGALYVKGDFSEATEEIAAAVESSGLQQSSAQWFGFIARASGRPDRALPWYDLATHYPGRAANLDNMIGDTWADLCEDSRAEAAYRRLSDFRPELPDGWMGICRLRLLAQDFAAAREICERQLSRYPQFSLSTQLIAQVEFFSLNYESAERLYAKLAQEEPDGGATGYGAVSYRSALGTLQLLRGDEAGGTATLTEALRMEFSALASAPEHPEALYRVAAVEASLNQRDSALAHLLMAFNNGWVDYRSTRLDPRFASLREEPLFNDVLTTTAQRLESLRVLATNP